MQWSSEDRDAIVKAFYRDGQSASEIAAVYRVSRNTIIGVAHREARKRGLAPKGPATRAATPATERRPRAARPSKGARPARFSAAPSPALPPSVPLLPPPPPVPQMPALAAPPRTVAIGDLRERECRFPVTPHDAPRDAHRFCGLPASGSYCSHHEWRAHR